MKITIKKKHIYIYMCGLCMFSPAITNSHGQLMMGLAIGVDFLRFELTIEDMEDIVDRSW